MEEIVLKYENFYLRTADDVDLCVYHWKPEVENCRAIVQISHGMAEHAGRYEEFALRLVDKGFGVYANDHRGHGRTAGTIDEIGYFADDLGWEKVVADMQQVTEYIKSKWGDIPIFLFGHSMGSILARNYIMLYGNNIEGVILSGINSNPGILGDIGRVLARIECLVKGKRSKSPQLNQLTFGSYNKKFQPAKTDFDWLSRDEGEVEKYVNDPFCGGIFSCGFFYDLLTGIKLTNKKDNIRKIPKNLPILLISGEKDPVGNESKGVLELYNSYKSSGIKNVKYILYKDARHELLKEINRTQVFNDINKWINSLKK